MGSLRPASAGTFEFLECGKFGAEEQCLESPSKRKSSGSLKARSIGVQERGGDCRLDFGRTEWNEKVQEDKGACVR